MKLEHKDSFPIFGGISTIKVWKPGVIQKYLDYGLDLKHAKKCAEADGALVYANSVHNLIVTTGYALFPKLCAADDTTGLTYLEIGIGTTAPTVGDTQLVSSEARKQFTTRFYDSSEFTGSAFFPREDCTYNIKEVGIWYSPATASLDSGTLFARYLQSYDNSGGIYDLTFDYVLDFRAS